MAIGNSRTSTRKRTVRRKLKPFIIPDGFEMIVDTREQKPYPLVDVPHIVDTVRKGDYTIKGMEETFCIERKQMSDFYSYIGKERVLKTDRKMTEFQDIVKNGGFVGLVIDCDESEILRGSRFSKVSPEVARQFIVSWELRGFHVYMNKDRSACERWAVDRAIKFYKKNKG